jgi:hypothetical protein
MNPENKNLVLTLAYRYRWQDLRVFVNSLTNSGFKGDLVIFGSRLDRETIAILRSKGVIVQPVFLPLLRLRNVFLLPGWKPCRWLIKAMPSFNLKRALGKRVFNIMCARFAHFHHYVERNLHRYDKILIADVRDVCFQTDPFPMDDEHSIVSFLEEETIGASNANTGWMREVFGQHVPPALLKCTICCAGVTLGKAPAMLNYLSRMLESFFTVEMMSPVAGVDQAVHNVLFHGSHIPGCGMLKNGNRICMTMGSGEPFLLDENRNVMADGGIISILHQYDRHPELNRIILQKYGN